MMCYYIILFRYYCRALSFICCLIFLVATCMAYVHLWHDSWICTGRPAQRLACSTNCMQIGPFWLAAKIVTCECYSKCWNENKNGYFFFPFLFSLFFCEMCVIFGDYLKWVSVRHCTARGAPFCETATPCHRYCSYHGSLFFPVHGTPLKIAQSSCAHFYLHSDVKFT